MENKNLSAYGGSPIQQTGYYTDKEGYTHSFIDNNSELSNDGLTKFEKLAQDLFVKQIAQHTGSFISSATIELEAENAFKCAEIFFNKLEQYSGDNSVPL